MPTTSTHTREHLRFLDPPRCRALRRRTEQLHHEEERPCALVAERRVEEEAAGEEARGFRVAVAARTDAVALKQRVCSKNQQDLAFDENLERTFASPVSSSTSEGASSPATHLKWKRNIIR